MKRVRFKMEINYDVDREMFIVTAPEEFKRGGPIGEGKTPEEAIKDLRIALNLYGGYIWPTSVW